LNFRVATRLALVAGVLLCISQAAAAKAWRGIVPLHSTRAEVEKLLGPPNSEDSGYAFEDEQALITYSSRSCEKDLPGGWDLPSNTVVEIRVSSNKDITMADLPVQWGTLEKIYAVHTPQIDYLDAAEGVRYTTADGLVRSITYVGSVEDEKKFSCAPYKYAAPVPDGVKLIRFEQYPFDSYGKIPFEDAKARLDNFVIQLLESTKAKPNSRGFILVYAGRSAHVQEAKKVADCAKNYLVKVRRANPDSIVAVDAGYQDEFKVELYIMPNDAYPPMLKPTVSPKKVQILEGEFNPCKDEK
jgi:hypothetical protein